MIDFTATNEDDNTKTSAQEDESTRERGRRIGDMTLRIMDTLRELLPYLDDGVELMGQAHHFGAIPTNDWLLISDRHKGANVAVSAIDFKHSEITDANMARMDDFERRLMDIACWSIVDLRDLILDYPKLKAAGVNIEGLTPDRKKKALEKSKQLQDLLIKAGYTEVDKIWNKPALPLKKRNKL